VNRKFVDGEKPSPAEKTTAGWGGGDGKGQGHYVCRVGRGLLGDILCTKIKHGG